MSEADFARVLSDPGARTANYSSMVKHYYRTATDLYRWIWGDSFHFALFSASESRVEAILATERLIAEEGGLERGMAALDVGCGVGGPALNIARYSGAEITGVDIIEHHVAIAHEGAERLGLSHRTRFICADGMQLPFADGSFDCVYTFEAGCHLPHKGIFYREAARVLRAGGRFLGFDWMRGEDLTAQEETRYIEPICRNFALPYMITLSELESHLHAAGLRIVHLEGVSRRPTFARNWEPIAAARLERSTSETTESSRAALGMLAAGGTALVEAERAGAFIIGHWQALKPTA